MSPNRHRPFAGARRAGLLFALAMLLVATAFAGAGEPAFPNSPDDLRALRAAEVLQEWYNPADGLYKTTSWWNAANALTALIDLSQRTGSDRFWPVIANTFDRCKEFELYDESLGRNKLIRNFLNPWWDDEGWWALLWLDAYDLTGEARYLEMARVIFEDLTLGWDEVCGGGIYWKKPNIGKHTISNALFLLAAVRLHQRCPSAVVRDRTHLQWALATWQWLDQHRLLNEHYLVENGLDDQCQTQHGSYYTYNQGVLLGALIELSFVTREPAHLDRARNIAKSAIASLVHTNGILKEHAEPTITGDSAQFKGIFMRYLSRLHAVTPDPLFADFIRLNADAVWNLARNPATDQIGALWPGPFDSADAARQSSALDCLTSALTLPTVSPRVDPPNSSPLGRAPDTRVASWHVGPLDPASAAFVREVRRLSPDVLALQGLEAGSAERLATGAGLWGHSYSVFYAQPGHLTGALGLTSRQPIVLQEKLSRNLAHGLLHARTAGLEFLNIHLSEHDVETRRNESAQIVFRVTRLVRTGREALVLGNFNALSPLDAPLYSSETQKSPGDDPDYSVVSQYLACPLVDVGSRMTPSPQRRIIWIAPKGHPDASKRLGVDRARLDYILASPGLASRATRSGTIASKSLRSFSGHQPVFAEFRSPLSAQ